jgi:protoporphyrinogen oxidase
MSKTAVIIGAGPAGLTAGLELVRKTNIKPVILELSGTAGGISRTVEYKDNRIDIGGHRFFSKSGKVMNWWLEMFPLQGKPAKDDIVLGRDVYLSDKKEAPDPEIDDRVMLSRKRISRIFFKRRFFDYPVSMSMSTLKNLGFFNMIKISFSYIYSRVFPVKPEKSLEDFFINRFGRVLYRLFFKDYTEKVWGVPCGSIDPEWGAQRVKGVSVLKAIEHGIKKLFKSDFSVSQEGTETSLIERFLYPKYGPGQFWEVCAEKIKSKGGEILFNMKAVRFLNERNNIRAVVCRDLVSGEEKIIEADYVLSGMPVKSLIRSFPGTAVPRNVREAAEGLKYRDFLTVGLLLRELKMKNSSGIRTVNNIIPDNWIYIQEKDVRMGRIQIFNNWSPYMVKDTDKVWIGLEYFCDEGDSLWNMGDEQLRGLAVEEAAKIGMIEENDVIDSVVVRSPKAYPAYFGTYNRLSEIRKFTDRFRNLFLIGRNGMHRYNNQDHSMLSAMTAVDNIVNGISDKDNVWGVNTEQEYHEKKKEDKI